MSSLYLMLVSSAACTIFVIIAAVASRRDLETEDRRFLDPVPSVWRLIWPAVRLLERPSALLLARFGRIQKGIERLLVSAGLDRAMNAAQLLAVTWVVGLSCAVLVGSLQKLLTVDGEVAVLLAFTIGTVIGSCGVYVWIRRQVTSRQRVLIRQLPIFSDFIAMCVEAGLPIGAALNQVAERGPVGPLRYEFARALRDIKTGRTRSEALQAMADRLNLPAVSHFVLALIAADREGIGIVRVLKAQAEQQRIDRFYRAETLAMQAPVKMLAPMVLFIFPGTFVILMFPVASRLFVEGIIK